MNVIVISATCNFCNLFKFVQNHIAYSVVDQRSARRRLQHYSSGRRISQREHFTMCHGCGQLNGSAMGFVVIPADPEFRVCARGPQDPN